MSALLEGMRPLVALGLVGLGILIGLLIGALWRGGQTRLARRLLGEGEAQRQAETEALLDGVKLAFGDISLDTFRRLSEQMLSQAQAALSAERRLQGQQLSAERAESEARLRTMLGQLERMQVLIRDIERDREQKFGRLESELRLAGRAGAGPGRHHPAAGRRALEHPRPRPVGRAHGRGRAAPGRHGGEDQLSPPGGDARAARGPTSRCCCRTGSSSTWT